MRLRHDYVVSDDAWAASLIKAVKLKERMKRCGRFRGRRWERGSVRRLADIARAIWEYEERCGFVKVKYGPSGGIAEVRLSIKDLRSK